MVLLGEPTDGTSLHTLDVSRSGLLQVGQPGVPAAVPVVDFARLRRSTAPRWRCR